MKNRSASDAIECRPLPNVQHYIRRVRSSEREHLVGFCEKNGNWGNYYKAHAAWIRSALLNIEAGQIVFGLYISPHGEHPSEEGDLKLAGCVFLKRSFHNSAELKNLVIASSIRLESEGAEEFYACELMDKAVAFSETNEIARIEIEVPDGYKDMLLFLVNLGFSISALRNRGDAGACSILVRYTGHCYRGDPFDMLRIGRWLIRSLLAAKPSEEEASSQQDDTLNVLSFEPHPQRYLFSDATQPGYNKRIRGKVIIIRRSHGLVDAERAMGEFKDFDQLRYVLCSQPPSGEALERYRQCLVTCFTIQELANFHPKHSSTLSIPFPRARVGGVITVLDRESILRITRDPVYLYYLISGMGVAMTDLDKDRFKLLVFYCPYWVDERPGIVGFADVVAARREAIELLADPRRQEKREFPSALKAKDLAIYATSNGRDSQGIEIQCENTVLFADALSFPSDKIVSSQEGRAYLTKEGVGTLINACYLDVGSCDNLRRLGLEGDHPLASPFEYDFVDGQLIHKKYAIAISYSGADVDKVRPIALALARRYGREKIFFDEFHSDEITGGDRRQFFERVYKYEAELVVAFFTRGYPNRLWAGGIEWRAIKTILKNRYQSHGVLLFIEKSVKRDKYFSKWDIWPKLVNGQEKSTIIPRIVARLKSLRSRPSSN